MATDFTSRLFGAESGGDIYARNPRSSAAGQGQFIASTFLNLIGKYRPDLAAGKTREQVLQLRYDPVVSREMADRYNAENADYLTQRGFEPSEQNLSLAYFAGPAGASAVLANPDKPVEATLTPAAIQANPFLRGKTNAEVASWAGRRVSSPSVRMANNLQQRFAPKTEGGAQAMQVAGGSGRTSMAGGEGMDQLKSALGGKSYNPDRIAAYGNLTKTGQDVASKATGWQQALLGIGTAGVGGFLQGRENEKKKEFDAALMGAVAGAQNPIEVAKALIQSPDERIKSAGLELLAKNLGQAPQSRTVDGPYGTKITQDYVGGQWVTQGGPQSGAPNLAPAATPEPQAAPQAAEVASQAAGAPGSPQPAPAAPNPAMLEAAQPAALPVPAQAEQPMPQQTMEPPVPAIEPGYKIGPAVPKAPDNYVHKLAPGGNGYLYDPSGQPVFETKTAADERAKSAAKRADEAPARAVTTKQISGNLNQIAEVINDTKPDRWNLAFGQYGGDETATPYENPVSYLVGSAKRAGVALGEELFGKEGDPTASGLRRKVDAPAADLVMTYRAIQKQRGVADSQQSNADLAFLESVAGRLKGSNSREEAYDLLNTGVRPIFERLTGEPVRLPTFKEWKKVKRNEEPSANAPIVPAAQTFVTGSTPSAGNWQDYLSRYGY
jgi:hypothetical protein